MKRCIALFLSLCCIMLLFAGCKQPLVDSPNTSTSEQTEPSTSKTEPTTEETVGNTEPSETVENTEPSAELSTAEDFEKFIKDNEWYWRALGCIFEKPEDIPAWFYFYLGVGDYTQATGEELAFILDAFQQKNPNTANLDYAHEYTRLPVAKINEALSILGITIEDIQIPDRWVYYDKLDCYYFWVSDAYIIEGWSVTGVEKGTEGIVAVYWETDNSYWGDPALEKPSKGAKMVLTMRRQPDGSWRVQSNVPQE